jgi:hypothetical protein
MIGRRIADAPDAQTVRVGRERRVTPGPPPSRVGIRPNVSQLSGVIIGVSRVFEYSKTIERAVWDDRGAGPRAGTPTLS